MTTLVVQETFSASQAFSFAAKSLSLLTETALSRQFKTMLAKGAILLATCAMLQLRQVRETLAWACRQGLARGRGSRLPLSVSLGRVTKSDEVGTVSAKLAMQNQRAFKLTSVSGVWRCPLRATICTSGLGSPALGLKNPGGGVAGMATSRAAPCRSGDPLEIFLGAKYLVH
jgi:hypothetical protein